MASPTQVEPRPPTEPESTLLPSLAQLSLTVKQVKEGPNARDKTQQRRVESSYTRRAYVPKPVIAVERVEPVVEHSEPREAAAHVRRRDDNKFTALPPPLNQKGALSKTSGGVNGGGGKDEGELEEDDTDDEYQSAPEEQWPEEIWKDDPTLVRDVVPASQEDISSAIDALNAFLKENNLEAAKALERDLKSYQDDILAMDGNYVSNFDRVAKAMKDLATLYHTLLESDDTGTQEKIRIDLGGIASRTDQLWRDF
ncbi:hypothetical protein IFR05_010861 [Cadophora sp. M221]|nr:hypothetical protein IFR05_010861 [Cadophora sp. M221]